MSFIRPGRSAAVGGGTDPYPLYTSFDRNELPFHTAAGSWGAQVPFQAPTPPTTTRSVTVHNLTDFNTEADVDGTQITIGTGWAHTAGSAYLRANDLDIIIPPGVAIGAIQISEWPYNTNYSRIRIRKPDGESRGGRIGRFSMQNFVAGTGTYTDIIVDGIDSNAAADIGPGENNIGFTAGPYVSRVFMHNIRAVSGQFMFSLSCAHLLIALCSFRAAAVNRTTVGVNEGWCYRGYATPAVIVDSHLETTRYHVIRPHTYDHDNEYFFIARSKLVNLSEGKIGWLGNKLTDPAFGYWWAAWVKDCEIYSAGDSTCASAGGTESQVLSLNNCTYSRITGNTIYSGGTGNAVTWTQSNLTSERNTAISNANGSATLISRGRAPLPADAHSSDSDLATNTFLPLTGRPSWGGAGDPTGIPLPNGWTLNNNNTDVNPTCAAVW